MKEIQLMRDIQLEMTRLGHRLFRNNVGVLKTTEGQYVKYGLCIGSSDLIGWHKDGCRFLAIEVKTPNGRVTPEQQQFIDAVRNAGGISCIARSVADAVNAVKDDNGPL